MISGSLLYVYDPKGGSNQIADLETGLDIGTVRSWSRARSRFRKATRASMRAPVCSTSGVYRRGINTNLPDAGNSDDWGTDSVLPQGRAA